MLAHARREVESGEAFLEFRIDYLPDPMAGVDAIRSFARQEPDVTILATCRRHQNHGRYNGSVEEQVRILEAAIDAGAHGIDIEIESAELAHAQVEHLRSKAWVIVSFHNFSGTPLVDPVLKRMLKIPADGYKLVTMAKKPSDSHRVLELASDHPKTPLVMLAMGESGLATRVLSPAHGALYTYAAPNANEGTAPGQISARLLRQLYRADKLKKSTKVYGVIADPVRHSISPMVHNRAFQSKRLDAVYLPFLVQPVQLKDFFLLADKLPIAGVSVTIPHKQKVLRYLDIVDPLARRIGAVNTVWRKGGKWRGINTDVQGVLAPLKKRLNLAKSTVLIAGNGGAARGAAFALADAGAKLTIAGRNADRVRSLAKLVNAEAVSISDAEKGQFDALVHCTPVGMWPNCEACLFRDNIPADLVFDMVYNPLETTLLRRAKDEGLDVVPGLQMFLEQAVHQFETFTGESAPRAVMERAALDALGHK
jgi:3-dehydroquinate dehydratase/shikimate dehydrogenase